MAQFEPLGEYELTFRLPDGSTETRTVSSSTTLDVNGSVKEGWETIEKETINDETSRGFNNKISDAQRLHWEIETENTYLYERYNYYTEYQIADGHHDWELTGTLDIDGHESFYVTSGSATLKLQKYVKGVDVTIEK